ncbi:MAG: hypothetical protein FGF51_05115 [Candidatus Brockarchaeota archaeon]|nr:hypothetical protein [Candidatus Brockarchaeota archaeon]
MLTLKTLYRTRELNAFTDKRIEWLKYTPTCIKNILGVFSKRGIRIVSPMYVTFKA